ncbi:IclR family transcriptional regulator [Gordonia rubripertincta]|uniref:IclR family transcriptional regulator n=1 Tax=Gordonia rubripertincta TaxID=36822 RepID=A0AAW4G4N0_GORRU|nr:IclR family transcriptional regulator [Gordonia rubripertincta]MBM7278507.1 IclR family transcriptional regulator [Gordonia rubripertincta]QMU23105.1 IclR family transcriptional regulator [Gordonia rubripertincta]TSD98287.1 IclR family transcriptional regulator [Gordonia rubripertincta]
MSEEQLDRSSVLGKAIAVLQAFDPNDRQVTLAELAERTALPKTTVHRLAGQLVAARLLNRTPNGYALGSGLFELGMRASPERGLIEVATPFMQDLYVRTGETVHLGILEDFEVVYVSKIGGHRQADAPSRLGGRMPLYCTAIGKALLANSPDSVIAEQLARPLRRRTPHTIVAPGLLRAQLNQIAEDGVSFEFEESTLGLVCVAAPILDADDAPLAAISVTGPVHRFHPRAHATAVRAAAAGASSTLARRAHLIDG